MEVAMVLTVLKSRLKIRTKTAKFTNMIIARFRKQLFAHRK